MELTLTTRGGSIRALGVKEADAAEFLDAYRSFLEGAPQTQYEFSFPTNVKILISFQHILGVRFQ